MTTTTPKPDRSQPIWAPDPDQARASTLADFSSFADERFAAGVRNPLDYTGLWTWSTEHIADFWEAVWTFFGIHSHTPYTSALTEETMPGAQWFSGSTVNYAEYALTNEHTDSPALICIQEDGRETTVTWTELRSRVAALAVTLRQHNVTKGDRVVGYLPPGQHAVIGFLAAASIGAIWSQCAQDFAATAVIDRFGQLEPTVLVAADGYSYNGRHYDRRDELATIRRGLPTVGHTIVVDHHTPDAFAGEEYTDVIRWNEAVDFDAVPNFTPVPFDHPLWVLFSSGTTGLPKGIVHSHGGVLLSLLSLLGLHMDLRTGDRLFWYTSTNWMMWNVVVSSLLTGATAVIYDGSPTFPDAGTLWRIADTHDVTFLGTSPGHLQACERAALVPKDNFDLSSLRTIGSTGSTLPAASYHWVHDNVGAHIQLSSTTGGTDAVTAFACSAPTTPVWPGELSARGLGIAMEAWDGNGHPLIGEVGELVITKPVPSMPVFFWNDPDGQRYHDAYFAHYPGVWRHGDWVAITTDGSVVMNGRSDSTLNRHGVRLGSSEIYQAVEKLPQIVESLIVGVDESEGSYWMPLFVVLADGIELDDNLVTEIRTIIRTQASPRHVPDEVIAVRSLPHTRTGKKIEVPLKRILQGAARDDVLSIDSIDDAAAVDQFVTLGNARRSALATPTTL
ncbi:acetoacetate--CoA ligase [Rhodococcus sp. 06-235-1A]|uniref:acetoacetate--CoA ligase n=1 Tax=Rhodococcus sp. 06-235-1A TaxID=2022508 RepID=UPI000B9BD36B|nr:acetoacetate--CoA ligase [Rhodococcus sp. 06-235-1A]OZD06567.1 acetoacetate--CoA ligase [Rhodococcus sp. 06-235-1A]